MSFLTSLLSDIDPSAAAKAPTPSVKPPQSTKTPKPGPGHVAGINGTTLPQQTKRKAESDATPGPNKVPRRDAPPGPNGTARPTQGVNGSKPKPTDTPDLLPYRGTATPVAKTPNLPKPNQKRTPDPVLKSITAGTQTPYPGSMPALKAQPKPVASQAAPKAGSYAAILAKAKEAQAAKSLVPTIKHKPAEILTRKERSALQAEAKSKKPPGAERKATLNGPGKALESNGARPGVPRQDKPKPKPADLGYQGTMRPKASVESGYQGTMRGGPLAPKRTGTSSLARRGSTYDRSRSGSLAAKPKPAAQKGGRMAGYANYSASDLEDEDDYGSDVSSDMEAGAWDVEEEERRAAIAAKKEDEEELRRENELKRLKAERKRKGLI